MAWTRTALALLVTAALLLRAGFTAGNVLLGVAAGALVVAAGALWALGRYRNAAVRAAAPTSRRPGSPAHLSLVAGVAAVAGVTVLVTVLLSARTDG